MLSNNIISLLNKRIQSEEFSSKLYKSMAVWFEYNGYTGAAKLFNKYACEESNHATWSYQYLLDLGLKPIVPAIEKPESEFESLPDILKQAYEHEIKITEECKELALSCNKEGDFLTFTLAQKYLTEQIDEIAKTTMLLDNLEAFGDSKVALRLLDNEMATM